VIIFTSIIFYLDVNVCENCLEKQIVDGQKSLKMEILPLGNYLLLLEVSKLLGQEQTQM